MILLPIVWGLASMCLSRFRCMLAMDMLFMPLEHRGQKVRSCASGYHLARLVLVGKAAKCICITSVHCLSSPLREAHKGKRPCWRQLAGQCCLSMQPALVGRSLTCTCSVYRGGMHESRQLQLFLPVHEGHADQTMHHRTDTAPMQGNKGIPDAQLAGLLYTLL